MQLSKTAVMLGLSLSMQCAAGAAMAHHSFALFDRQKTVSIAGTVKSFEWANPHVWISVEVAQPGAQPVLWPVESASVIDLKRMGWQRDSLKPGDSVTMVLNPLRDGKIGGSLVSASSKGVQIGHSWNYKAP